MHDYPHNAHPTIIGIDEVGRGPLAGPVIAGAAYLGPHYTPTEASRRWLRDSKKLSKKQLESAFGYIQDHPDIHWAIGAASTQEIATHNILQATFIAMHRAITRLCIDTNACIVYVDGSIRPPWGGDNVHPVIGGDALHTEISIASIVAKVHRDHAMKLLHDRYPNYGWERNAGYGTKAHIQGIRDHGITPHHRRGFAPIDRACIRTTP